MTNNKLLLKIVIFSIIEGNLKVFLKNNLLPTLELRKGIFLDDSVEDLLKETLDCQLEDYYLEQLYTFSQIREGITVVYYFLLQEGNIPSQKKKYYLVLEDSKKKTNDEEIITYALQRLRWKIEYTNIVYSLLPHEFSLSELQTVYEAILGKELDKRNFRKKILSLKLLKKSGKKTKGVPARPAQLYQFRKRKPEIVKIF